MPEDIFVCHIWGRGATGMEGDAAKRPTKSTMIENDLAPKASSAEIEKPTLDL